MGAETQSPSLSPRTQPKQRTVNSVHAAGWPGKTAQGLLGLQAVLRGR